MMSSRGARYEAVADHELNDVRSFEIESVKIWSRSVCVLSYFKTTLLIATYFAPSIGLTFYQKWLLKDFHYPLSVVMVHLIVKFVLAVLVREVWGCIMNRPRKILPWRQFIRGIAPTGIASGLDVGLSNWGLELVPISLYSMTKSTTIIFILICGLILKLEKKSWSLVLIVLMISMGLTMFNYKSTQFNLLGFLLLLFASFVSGIRWTCAQLIMQKSSVLKNPVDMIYHVQPWMIVSLLPFAILVEGPSFITSCRVFRYSDVSILYATMLKVLAGALLAFCMEITEFLVVTYTSGLTLSIAGIFKEILIVVLAVVFNGDKISELNAIGLIICLGGISSHVVHRIQTNVPPPVDRLRDEAVMYKVGNGHELKMPLIASDGGVSTEAEESDSQIIFDVLNSRDR